MATPKTIKVTANYPDVFVPVGDQQMLWGVTFTHEVVQQDNEDMHVLSATLDEAEAKVMASLDRVSKAL